MSVQKTPVRRAPQMVEKARGRRGAFDVQKRTDFRTGVIG